MRSLYLVVGLIVVFSSSLSAQSNGDYQSRQTGNWNTVTTWQVFNAGSWADLETAGAGVYQGTTPTNASGIITIMDLTTVTVPAGASITADQIEYENNGITGTTGILSVAAGGSLTIANGPGDDVRFLNDFTAIAVLEVAGTLTLSNAATMVDDDYGNLGGLVLPVSSDTYKILNGGTHIHTTGAGVAPIPSADWQTGSTCQVNATTGAAPAMDSGIQFYNFVWNGASQSATINLAGNLRTVLNDFTVTSTNGSTVQLSTATSYTLNISRHFVIQNNSRVTFGVNANPVAINVGGDLDISSTSATGSAISANAIGVLTLGVTGNFIKSGVSTITLISGSAGSTTVNIEGNFSHTGGGLTKSSSSGSTATINFVGPSTSTFLNTASITNAVNFAVGITKTLDLGTSAITGTGTFNLAGNSTLRVGSPQGLTVPASNSGNIRTTGVRTYAANSNIVYSSSSAQALGNEWATGGALNNAVVNLEIDNTSLTGVSNNVGGSTNVVGNLVLTNGILNIGASNTLNVRSNFSAGAGMIGGSPTSRLLFTNIGLFSGSLIFAPGLQDLEVLDIGRPGNIPLGSSLTIAPAGRLTFGSGSGNLIINGQTLTINGDIQQTGPGTITSTVNTSNLNIGGVDAITNFALSNPIQLNNVTLSRTGATAVYNWSSSTTISGMIDLVAGTFNHVSGVTMGTGSTFQRRQGSTFSGSTLNASTRYSVSYIGVVSTTAELPASATLLENLTTLGDVTLDKDISINGNLNINGGQFIAGAHNITMLGPSFAVNGGTFNINLANTVTFSRAGTTLLTGTTINESQFGNFVISSGTTVDFPDFEIRIGAQWNIQGTFIAHNGTVSFNGASPQNINSANQPFWNVIITGSTKTLTSSLDINGSIIIGSTLAAGSNTINIAGLWDNNGVFQAGTGTVIFDGNSQTIENNSQAFTNVTFAAATPGATKTLGANLDVNGGLSINANAVLDVDATGNYQINVTGNFINSGTFIPRTGTVILDGGSVQNLAGNSQTVFNNLTLSNAVQVTVNPLVMNSVAGVLTLNSGVFHPNSRFTMLSSATRDARLAPVPLGVAIISNMIVQRYLRNTNGTASFRYLASPFTSNIGTNTGARISDWKNNPNRDFPVTGSFIDPSTIAEWPQFPNMGPGPSVYRYDEDKPGGVTVDDRYTAFPLAGTASTAAASILENGRGYVVLVRQNAPITYDLLGIPATGDVVRAVTSKSNVAVPATNPDGWNLLGNPYASPIHWDNVTINPAVIQAQIAIKDNTNNLGVGTYAYYTQGGPAIPGAYDGTISQGQAFWVRKLTSGTSNITFEESDKVAVENPPFIRKSFQDLLRINVAGNTRQDELIIRFEANALDVTDSKYDAFKLKNDFINFSSLAADGTEMAINAFSALSCAKEIPLVLKAVTPGAHVFTFSDFESFPEDVKIRLVDKFTNETFLVTEANSKYHFSVTTDANSFGNNRFQVVIGYPDVDLSLGVQAQDVCEGTDALIHIQAPQAGVVYHATLHGTVVSDEVAATNGSDVVLSIPRSNLTGTDNTIVLMAKVAGCVALPLNNSVVVNVKGIPTISSVTGEARCGEGSLTLIAAGAPGSGGYKWYLTEDATDAIAGEAGSTFVTPSLNKTKTYFVSAVNSLGCEGGRMAVTATVTYAYEIAGVTGAKICGGESSTISATGAPEDGSYRWYLSQASVEPIPGQSAASFPTGELATTTTYYVTAVNSAGCESARVPVTIDVTPISDATITVEGNMLTSNSETGNQWYLNGTAIPGATGKTYTANESGAYKLVVTQGTCTTQIEQEFAVTGDIDIAGQKGYLVYPNASTGIIYIEVATTNSVEVSVKNQLGVEVAKGALKQEGAIRKGQLDITGHASGMYLVVIKSGGQTVIRKIVKN
ncbi:MAG TPA: T9SS type A sorting domain-containing protein [Cyclobacteriaceae bacterium]|nr:T9SS type A sorting domain-containing protein [Cyclobacteriaceae bacterium]